MTVESCDRMGRVTGGRVTGGSCDRGGHVTGGVM